MSTPGRGWGSRGVRDWEEGAGTRKGLGAPRKAADCPGLSGGCKGRPQPPAPQDTDDKWACMLGRQRRLCWGHRSPSPGSHTAVLPGATAHLTAQPSPWTRGWGVGCPPGPQDSGGGSGGLVQEPSQQLLAAQGPRGCLTPTWHAVHKRETPPDTSTQPACIQRHIHLHTCPNP